ncbi:MAG: lipid-A-disaccharide synthase [Gammaproteobacteria bacterium]|nr:lipid-A-disaccharide synthase [Gammaproteobacteria bacterium]
MTLKVAIVAGEASGDLLGAGLMAALKREEDCQFEGICGPAMMAQGGIARYPLDRLAVTGITEVAGRVPDILRMRRDLLRHFRKLRPDCLIGIDAPDFTLALERAMKRDGIPVVHYVSPTVWAWRRYRVRTVARSADLLLTLLPFEPPYYEGHMPAVYVGHPLADQIAESPGTAEAREQLRMEEDGLVIALLPGSRENELKAHAPLFVRTAMRLAMRYPQCRFIAPFVNRATRVLFEEAMRAEGAFDLPLVRMHGHAAQAMAAADIVIVASGTAALEAALVGRPMIVTYRVSPFSYHLARRFIRLDYYSLPNHLIGAPVVPELIQNKATPDHLVAAAERLIENPGARAEMVAAFAGIRRDLRRNANQTAARAILDLVARRRAGAA